MRFTNLALLAVVASLVGCAADTRPEPLQSTQSKLLAPKPLFKATASDDTKATLGITEWRIYRGKTDYVLSGHDAKGKAVQGASIAFVKDENGNAILRARALDGTYFAGKHVFGGQASANGAANAKTTSFFHSALVDMNRIRVAVAEKNAAAQGGTLPTGIDPLATQFGALGASCGGDLSSMLMGAMQCLAQQNGLVTTSATTANTALLQQCALASQGAAASTGTCVGGVDPSGLGLGMGEAPFDPWSMGQDPYGAGDMGGMGQIPGGGACPICMAGGQGSIGYGDTGDYGGYGAGMQDPLGGIGQDPYGMGDPFGGGSCMSCQGGGYDDIQMDPMSGGVDCGGAGMGGGDMGGFGEGY